MWKVERRQGVIELNVTEIFEAFVSLASHSLSLPPFNLPPHLIFDRYHILFFLFCHCQCTTYCTLFSVNRLRWRIFPHRKSLLCATVYSHFVYFFYISSSLINTNSSVTSSQLTLTANCATGRVWSDQRVTFEFNWLKSTQMGVVSLTLFGKIDKCWQNSSGQFSTKIFCSLLGTRGEHLVLTSLQGDSSTRNWNVENKKKVNNNSSDSTSVMTTTSAIEQLGKKYKCKNTHVFLSAQQTNLLDFVLGDSTISIIHCGKWACWSNVKLKSHFFIVERYRQRESNLTINKQAS